MKTKWSHKDKLRLCHRALVKIGLEWVALTRGVAAAVDASFDRERQMVLTGGDYSGYILAPARVMLNTDEPGFIVCDVPTSAERPHLVIIVTLLGLVFGTDTLNAEPPQSLSDNGLKDIMQVLKF